MNHWNEDLRELRRKLVGLEEGLADARRRLLQMESSLAWVDTPAASPPVKPVTQPEIVPESPPREAPVSPKPPPLPGGRRAPEPSVTAPPTFHEPPAWQQWLQRLQLWPPRGEGNLEVRLGAWWTTRIGAMLAVIGLVFFGVYLSVDTLPWVKFLEMTAIAIGVTGSGFWLERRMPRFGTVVLAAGLAMIYFAIYAGYALPAVKVISSPWIAACAQLLAAGGLAWAAVKRRHETVATVALALGFVTAWFSRTGGLSGLALVTAMVMALAGVVAWRRLRWRAPGIVGLAGAYALWATLVWDVATEELPDLSRWWLWGSLVGLAVTGFARDWRSGDTPKHPASDAFERRFQMANTTVATLLGVAAGLWVWPSDLGGCYFAATAVLGTMAWLRHRQMSGDEVAAVFLAKATGTAALTVIEVTDGRTTAMALLVQAGVLWVTARRIRSTVMAMASPLTALVASGFFVIYGIRPIDLLTVTAAGQALWLVGLVALAVEWSTKEADNGLAELWALLPKVGVGAATVLGAWAMWLWSPSVTQPLGMVVVGSLGLIGAWPRRSPLPAIASGAWLMLAHVRIDIELLAATGEITALWMSWCILQTVTVVGAVVVTRRWGRAEESSLALRGADGLVMLALVTTVQAVFAVVRPDVAFAVSAVGSLIVSWGVIGTRRLAWTWLASGVLLAALALVGNISVWDDGWLALGAVPLLGISVWRRGTSIGRETEGAWPGLELREAGVMALATGMLIVANRGFSHGQMAVAGLALLASGALSLAWRGGVRAALPASWVLLLATVTEVGRMSSTFFSAPGVGALAVAWAGAIGLELWRSRSPEAFHGQWWWRNAVGIHVALASGLTIFLMPSIVHKSCHVLGLSVVMLGIGVVARWRSMAAMVTASRCLGLWMAIASLVSWLTPQRGVLFAAAGLAVLPLVGGWGRTDRRWTWAVACGGLAVAMVAALTSGTVWRVHATVVCGGAAVVIFLLGLFGRLRPHRLVGLAGLAFCVVRVFVVDLDETLHRIIAFGVLGVGLLWVGFSYHRFRHLISDESVAPLKPVSDTDD